MIKLNYRYLYFENMVCLGKLTFILTGRARIVLPPWCLHSVGTLMGSKYFAEIKIKFELTKCLSKIILFFLELILDCTYEINKYDKTVQRN